MEDLIPEGEFSLLGNLIFWISSNFKFGQNNDYK